MNFYPRDDFLLIVIVLHTRLWKKCTFVSSRLPQTSCLALESGPLTSAAIPTHSSHGTAQQASVVWARGIHARSQVEVRTARLINRRSGESYAHSQWRSYGGTLGEHWDWEHWGNIGGTLGNIGGTMFPQKLWACSFIIVTT